MGFRCGSNDVKGIIAVASENELGEIINITAFIRTANILTNKVSANDSDSLLSAADLKEIETYLAAHFYTHHDRQYDEKTSDDSREKYQGKTAMYLDSSLYGQTAKMLDITGYLASLQDQAGKGKKIIGMEWLGKPRSEEIEYVDRD